MTINGIGSNIVYIVQIKKLLKHKKFNKKKLDNNKIK